MVTVGPGQRVIAVEFLFADSRQTTATTRQRTGKVPDTRLLGARKAFADEDSASSVVAPMKAFQTMWPKRHEPGRHRAY